LFTSILKRTRTARSPSRRALIIRHGRRLAARLQDRHRGRRVAHARRSASPACPVRRFFREPEHRYVRFHFAKKEETLRAAGRSWGRLKGRFLRLAASGWRSERQLQGGRTMGLAFG
jgi:hypothetical protein